MGSISHMLHTTENAVGIPSHNLLDLQ